MSGEALEDRLAAVRAAKEAKAKAAAEVAAEREIEEFELEERFEKELGGKRGERFAILDFDGDGGFVVLARGAPVLYKRFVESKVEAGDISTFVLPQVVHPEKDVFKERANELYGMWAACANALSDLHKLRAVKIKGKA